MAKSGEHAVVKSTSVTTQFQAKDLLYIIGLFALGGVMYRSGYDLGLRVSKQVLKRHDKDVRKMERQTKKYLNDYKIEKKEKEKKKWLIF